MSNITIDNIMAKIASLQTDLLEVKKSKDFISAKKLLDEVEQDFCKIDRENLNIGKFLLCVMYMKSEYITIYEFEKAYKFERKITERFLNYVYEKSTEASTDIEDDFEVYMIILEFISVVNIHSNVNEEIYKLIKRINPEYIIQRMFTYIIEDEKINVQLILPHYELSKNIHYLIYKILEEKDLKLFNKWHDISCMLMDDYIIYFTGDEEGLEFIKLIIESNNEDSLINKVNKLEDLKTIYKIIIEIEYTFLHVTLANCSETHKMKNNICERLRILIVKLLNKIDKKDCEISDVKCRISKIIENFIEFAEEEAMFVVINYIKKSSCPKYKKEFLELFIMQEKYIDDLFKMKEYKLIVKMYKNNHDIDLENYFFEIAYSASEIKDYKTSQKLYNYGIEKGLAGASTYNNLGVVFEERDNDYTKALELYEKAKSIEKQELYDKNIKRVKKAIKEMENIYFNKTQTWNKKLLFAIYKIADEEQLSTNYETLELLSSILGESTKSVEKNINILLNLGCLQVIEGQLIIHTVINRLIKNHIDPKIERKIIKVDNNKFFRPIFHDESEIIMYRTLIEIFPNHLVFPNIGLKNIIDVQKIKDYLSDEMVDYLFKAQVNFAVINTTSYFPVVVFEKDSEYNDTEIGKKRAEYKDTIFKIGGVPLARIRYNTATTNEQLKCEIKEITKELLLDFRKNSENYHLDLLEEFSPRLFGINESKINIEKLQKDWVYIVGDYVGENSKIKYVEGGSVKIELSINVKELVEIGKEKIKNRLKDMHKDIEEITFMYK